MKSLFTLLTLLFTLTVGAQPPSPPGGDTPPSTDPHGMPICYSGCFAGCSPISPSCQAKNLGIIEQAIEDLGLGNDFELKPMTKSVTIIKNGVINRTSVSKNKASQISFDIYTGHFTSINKLDGVISEQEFFFKPYQGSLLDETMQLQSQLITSFDSLNEKSECSDMRGAVNSAMDNLEAAAANGATFSELSDAANDVISSAVAYVTCVIS